MSLELIPSTEKSKTKHVLLYDNNLMNQIDKIVSEIYIDYSYLMQPNIDGVDSIMTIFAKIYNKVSILCVLKKNKYNIKNFS